MPDRGFARASRQRIEHPQSEGLARPATPSPVRSMPRPVSQAERTTISVPLRFMPTISCPVSIPSLAGPVKGEELRRLAPASASPQRRSGLTAQLPFSGTSKPSSGFKMLGSISRSGRK